MSCQRAAFLVMVDLDPGPGWGHDPESWRAHLEADLLSRAGHYNPVVVEFTPADLEPLKKSEREAGAAEVRAKVEAVLPTPYEEEMGVLVRASDLRAALRGTP